jgi:ATP-dependent Zn protease
MTSNILLLIQCNKNYSKNIIQLSLYDNITNLDKIISINNGKNRISIKSNYVCIKITYLIDDIIDDIFSFNVKKLNNDNEVKNKNENFISYILLISSILLIIIIIWVFVICYKNKTGIMKEITIINQVKIKV